MGELPVSPIFTVKRRNITEPGPCHNLHPSTNLVHGPLNVLPHHLGTKRAAKLKSWLNGPEGKLRRLRKCQTRTYDAKHSSPQPTALKTTLRTPQMTINTHTNWHTRHS